MPGTTPVYGFPYPEPTDLVADYPALGQDLAEDIESVLPTIGGLVQAAPTSIANSGGSASLASNTVTFTGVNSVSLNGIFTSGNANYCLVYTLTNSTDATTTIRLRASGTDNTSAVYVGNTSLINSTSLSNIYSTGGDTLFTVNISDPPSQDEIGGYVNFHSPQLAENTSCYGLGFSSRTAVTVGAPIIFGGVHLSTTQFDGFTFYPNTGTMTGKLRMYKYAQ